MNFILHQICGGICYKYISSLPSVFVNCSTYFENVYMIFSFHQICGGISRKYIYPLSVFVSSDRSSYSNNGPQIQLRSMKSCRRHNVKKILYTELNAIRVRQPKITSNNHNPDKTSSSKRASKKKVASFEQTVGRSQVRLPDSNESRTLTSTQGSRQGSPQFFL